MDDLEKQLEAVFKAREEMLKGTVREEDLKVVVDTILQDIKDMKDVLEHSMAQNKGEMTDNIENVQHQLNVLEKDCKAMMEMMNKSDAKLIGDIDNLTKQLYLQVNVIKDMMPTMPNLFPLERRISEVEAKIPKIEPVILDGGEEIVDKINDLSTDDEKNKIDAKHIKNLPKGGDTIYQGANGINVSIGGTLKSISKYINFIAGSNVTITENIVGERIDISISSSGASANQANNETPSGTVNGVNDTFTLAHTPSPAASLKLYVNGQFMAAAGVDYTLTTDTIVFVTSAIPLSGSILRAFYDY